MKISIIIPTYNEEEIITDTIDVVKKRACNRKGFQIIVVDGASSDKTMALAKRAGATVVEAERGRAIQMNRGAEKAKYDILYFLHADTYPPENFDKLFLKMIKSGKKAGCFRLSFDHKHFLLHIYSWFTRFNVNAFRLGDQSLFITKKAFKEVGGFRKEVQLMEGHDIVRRIKRKRSFVVLPQKVVTSARSYLKNGIIRLQLIFMFIFIMHYLGLPQQRLDDIYHKLTLQEG